MVVRTWNLARGSSSPPGLKTYVRQMVELLTAGGPDVVCVQEVPAWALPRIGEWAGMKAVTVREAKPRLAGLPVPAAAGKAPGVASGYGSAILFPREAKLREERSITLNTGVYCDEAGRALGLTRAQTADWARERRVMHFVKYELRNRLRFLVANVHTTTRVADPRVADAELRRAVSLVVNRCELEETVIVAGDFNVARASSATIQALMTAPPESRWTADGAHVDGILLLRAVATSAREWSDTERSLGGTVLASRAPAEAEIVLRPKG